ncbi:hypothetical protein BDQ17DRAFT_1495863 [Cyathus striatus]|nr:hypothetical protein BDQ17DRAFT_1495863 [Cyathus striatus]
MPVSLLRHPYSSPLRAWQSRDPKSHRNICCLSLYVLISLCLTAAVLTLGIKFQVKDFSGVDLSNTNSSLSRYADLISVDSVASTLLMHWYIAYDSCFDILTDSCTPVNIYFDTDSGDAERTNQGETLPLFTWYPDQYNNLEYFTYPNFGTTLSLFDYGTTKSLTSVQIYPFDVYGTTEVATMVNIAVEYTYGVALTRPGISGFETTSDTSLSYYTPGGVYVNNILLRRSGLIKAYVISIVIGILFGYSQPKEALAVPIATLFAFTSLRGTMPGAPPGFGTVIGCRVAAPSLNLNRERQD